ncbi:MAG: DUF4129 domain-containing protein [Pyrinomonadaceae bacterium]
MSTAAFAETISEYRSKIHQAKQSVDILLGDDDEESVGAKNISAEREVLKQIRQILPPSERVEAGNLSVETQNKWLSEKLYVYERETDAAKRRAILTEVSERLGALETETGALEKTSAAAQTKDADKRKLAEILSREEYQKPAPPEENIVQKIWREFLEWLDRVFPKSSPFSIPEGGLSSLSFVLQILIYAAVLGGVGFLIYKFAPFLTARFRRRDKRYGGERVVLGETLTAETDSRTLFAEAEKLAQAGNLRAAIRKGYIALLCDLSDRKIIGLAKNKTNRDYLRDVRPRREIFDEMKNLTNNFERNWYGFGATRESDWREFREKYNLLSEQLRIKF